MPHIFKVQCYKKHMFDGKAKRGDVVYLKSLPDTPMTVSNKPTVNQAAQSYDKVIVQWMTPSGVFEAGEFFADQLSL